MIVQIDTSPIRAQYLAALVEFWDLCDEGSDLEDGYAIYLLPKFIRNIAYLLDSYKEFTEMLVFTAEEVKWSDEDKKTILAIHALVRPDDSQGSK